ncbi:amidohydrolase [Pseudoalteromonas sp. CO325X]|uniref:amidohydrolase n=1 Tax=Pseudoalteromonas sp. CO325X TaxID=1777262 RepID=UPI001022D4D1|nr:amidohydrolase [Pseudoalteromonas sp. CO325X]RZF80261.1 amidohydrolase [Pseudoalteromonas sp. CO325X]
MLRILCLALLSAGIIACTQPQQPATKLANADTLYFGGPIITMAGDAPQYVEALATKDGRIIFTGQLHKANDHVGEQTKQVNLQGQALLPGFIDAHSHLFNAGLAQLSADLLPGPDGQVNSIEALLSTLTQWHQGQPMLAKKLGWIVGMGYDDSQLAQRRHPTATELDTVSSEIPILIMHQSGHLGVMNTKALEMVGYLPQAPHIDGGVIRIDELSNQANGVLEEMALFQPLFSVFSAIDKQLQDEIASAGLALYMANGYTTAQEGRADKSTSTYWLARAQKQSLPIDVAIYPDLEQEYDFMLAQGASKDYQGGARIAGVKLSFDGSPQGKTAWLSKPYLHPPAGHNSEYRGYPAIADDKARSKLVAQAYANNWQLIVHTNGDAAADALLRDIESAATRFEQAGRRTVMIHAQTVREDQLKRMKQLAVIPSFFSMHTFYWGDWHRDEVLGLERAENISPTGWAQKHAMRFTQHHDAPVVKPNPLRVLSTTVNRKTRSGKVLGAHHQVSPYIALKSMTEWAAWQYFEEPNKGTLEVGKLADFVILDKDPLRVEPELLEQLQVQQTIKADRVVYDVNHAF